MRFARLELLKYGHFDGCYLDFPAAESDLHIVFGQNEAGKSTTIAAISDLLFGFPNSTAFDFVHDQRLLRIGASLVAPETELNCRRKKGRKDTLLDAEERTVLDEGRLTAMLGGYSADSFRRMFSLDHHRLREGGNAIIEAKDDIGQAIFAAGSGLVGVSRLLQELEEDSKALWTKRAGGDRRYHAAQKAFDEAKVRLKQSQVRPAVWDDLRKRVAEIEDTLGELKDKRLSLETERGAVERQRRALPHVARYKDTLGGAFPGLGEVRVARWSAAGTGWWCGQL